MWKPRQQLDVLQKIAIGLMTMMVFVTFVAANLHAVLWQSSEWLVSTVLPAVVVDLTNEERAANNAAPLTRNATLDAAAKLKAEHMAKNQYFAHYSPEGVSPWYWFERAGYVYAHAGENLAIHFTDSEEVVQAWMDSPTHRKNIVDQKFTEIGVGTAKGTFDGYDTVYVVQLFGTPAVPPTPVTPPPAPTPEPTPIPATEPVAEPLPAIAEVVPEPTPEPVVVAASDPEPALVPEPIAEPVLVSDSEPVTSESLSEESTLDPSVSLTDIAELVTEAETVAVLPESELVPHDVVVLESPIISTSSGLAIAQVTSEPGHAGYTFASIATKPNRLLEFIYITLGIISLILISTSIFIEARRMQYRQVAYGIALLFVMSALWFSHAWLTSGAVIV